VGRDDQLTAIVERWRPLLVRVATRWCRRTPFDPEDLVQDALARMAEQRSFPVTADTERPFVLAWLRRAWASSWQHQAVAKRADGWKSAVSLDQPLPDGGVVVDRVAAPDDVEGVVLAREAARLVMPAVAGVGVRRYSRRGDDPRWARARWVRKKRTAAQAALAAVGWPTVGA
jgi:DNA-directed RNA polymerase specialized sigma24 family protein